MARREDVLNVSEEVGFPPTCAIRNAGTAQSIPTHTIQPVNFSTVIFDNDGMGGVIANRIKIITGGHYEVSFFVTFGPNGNGRVRLVILYRNSTIQVCAASQVPVTNPVFGTIISGRSPVIALNPNDSLSLSVYQDSGSSIPLQTAIFSPVLAAKMVGL